jgi:hypothetical protein
MPAAISNSNGDGIGRRGRRAEDGNRKYGGNQSLHGIYSFLTFEKYSASALSPVTVVVTPAHVVIVAPAPTHVVMVIPSPMMVPMAGFGGAGRGPQKADGDCRGQYRFLHRDDSLDAVGVHSTQISNVRLYPRFDVPHRSCSDPPPERRMNDACVT